jgi:hypothetical protein
MQRKYVFTWLPPSGRQKLFHKDWACDNILKLAFRDVGLWVASLVESAGEIKGAWLP